MKTTRTLALILFLYSAIMLPAQVSINNDGTAPHSSAMLEVKSTTRGLLPPRMTTDQRNLITTPAQGLVIFNTDCNDLQYYNGSGWVPVGNAGVLSNPGTISGNATPCYNATGISYSIAPVAGATGYHWTVPQGAVITVGQGTAGITVNFGTYSGYITVIAYSTCYKSGMSSLAVTVNPVLPVSISITTSANPVCEGTSVTFTANPVNGGTTPAYQWRKNGNNLGGATASTYTCTPLNGEAITCVLTSNLICKTGSPATSNSITMTVNPIVYVTLTVKALPHANCTDPSYTFQATATPSVTNPQYQWYLNGSLLPGATSTLYTLNPVYDDAVECRLTSNTTCIFGGVASDFQVFSGCNQVCYGEPIQLICNNTQGCSNPTATFHWENQSGSWTSSDRDPLINPGPGYASDNFYLTVNYAPPPGGLYKGVTVVQVIPQLNFSAVVTAASCAATCDGSVNLSVTGGIPPYGYTWSNGATTEDLNGVCSGVYSVTITDNSPCTKYGSWTVASGATVAWGGQTYNTVKIGSQCWLKENLNIGSKVTATTTQTNNGIIEKYCYNNSDASCTSHGGLYQWDEMMNYTASSNAIPSGRQGICPSGWHVPSDAEWCLMTVSLDPGATCSTTGWRGTDAGGKMKQTGTTNWTSPNTGATNSSGFTGLGAGYSNGTGAFSNQTYYAYLWTATEFNSTDVWNRRLGYNTAQEGRFSGAKTSAFSVRCVKD